MNGFSPPHQPRVRVLPSQSSLQGFATHSLQIPKAYFQEPLPWEITLYLSAFPPVWRSKSLSKPRTQDEAIKLQVQNCIEILGVPAEIIEQGNYRYPICTHESSPPLKHIKLKFIGQLQVIFLGKENKIKSQNIK